MSKILVFGTSGQVATELRRLAPVHALGRDTVDLANPSACAEVIRFHRSIAVIYAAAYTTVDRAETEEVLATTINGAAPAAMAEACAALRIPLVHISTDYVFDGGGMRRFSLHDATAPQNAYGRSKLVGEQGIRASGVSHAILRTSWVFSSHGTNFVKTMLRLSENHDELRVVDDQVGGPTPARSIVAAYLEIPRQLQADPGKSGTYNFTGAPDVNWCDFARAIFVATGSSTRVQGIPTREYPTPASRALNSRLDCSTMETTFNITRPDWRAGLADTLTERGFST